MAPALILLLLLRHMGVVTMLFNGNTRLPLVASWDNLLPSWFTRLHPRFRTPVNSILFVSAITIGFSLAGQIGVGVQEAFQLLENAAGILYAFTYLGLFAIPLFRRSESSAEIAGVVADCISVWFRDVAALLDAIGVSDYRSRELADIRV
jgi:amino acid transporter